MVPFIPTPEHLLNPVKGLLPNPDRRSAQPPTRRCNVQLTSGPGTDILSIFPGLGWARQAFHVSGRKGLTTFSSLWKADFISSSWVKRHRKENKTTER